MSPRRKFEPGEGALLAAVNRTVAAMGFAAGSDRIRCGYGRGDLSLCAHADLP